MPIYDFKCPDCGRLEEVLMLPGECWDQQNCDCKWGAKMRRRPAAPAVHFKGAGWTGKLNHRGLRSDWKSSEDTLEEDSNGKLRPKTGAGHETP